MGAKIEKLLLLLFLFICSVVMPVSASEVTDFVRVGITDNKFQNILKQEVTLYATAECDIGDKASRKILLRVEPNTDILVRNSLSGLSVTVADRTAILRDFVLVSQSGLLGIKGLQRKGVPAIYHGAFEVVQSKERNGFFVVNLVEIQ